MEVKDFKKIARLLKEAYASLQEEALTDGVDIFSDEYKQAVDTVRETILAKAGFTLEEYQQVKNQLEAERNIQKTDNGLALEVITSAKQKLDELNKIKVPTKEEVMIWAHEVAKEYIVPPVVTNQIVKETTKEVITEKPQIIETTRVINAPYNDTALKQQLTALTKTVEGLEVSKPFDPEPLALELKQFFHDNFSNHFEKNIDILGMPDWRKLAMGLQGQIDDIIRNGSGHTIEDEGTVLAARKYLNFVGAGVTATDDLANNATKVTVPGGGSSINFSIGEVPSGTVNGVNTDFTLANTPTANTLAVYRGGARQQGGAGKDYTLSGVTITFAYAPQVGEVILCDSQY